MESRVAYSEDDDNGLCLNGVYVPEELIAEILGFVDHRSLLNCQLVCVRWKTSMETYVWRKKAERVCHHSLNSVKNVNWSVYYAICEKQPFEKNLLKNCSGQEGIRKYWKIVNQDGDQWAVESPPAGVQPLPSGVWPFQGPERCFVTSYSECSKSQTINLAKEGLPTRLLDALQPPIMVSEWYSCRYDCEAIYDCCVQLLGEKDKVLDEFRYRAFMWRESRGKWHYVSHVFKNYGKGLRKIVYQHAGVDTRYWAGHFGSKTTCASVRVKLVDEPEPEPDTSCLPSEKPQMVPLEPELGEVVHNYSDMR